MKDGGEKRALGGVFSKFLIEDLALVAQLPDRLIVFDGVCNLCNGWVQFVLQHDKRGHFYFTPAQSALGQQLMELCGLDKVDFETNLYIEKGAVYFKMATVVNILPQFGGAWFLVRVLNVLPNVLLNWIYDRIAKNRYRIFGRAESCLRPDPAHEKRFINEVTL